MQKKIDVLSKVVNSALHLNTAITTPSLTFLYIATKSCIITTANKNNSDTKFVYVKIYIYEMILFQ